MVLDSLAKDFVIPFVLDEKTGQADQPLIYRPWGTRTIKLRITAHSDMPKLWVRPQGVLPEEAALGLCKAHADDSCAFHITWGGGHECGPCVKTKDVLSAFEALSSSIRTCRLTSRGRIRRGSSTGARLVSSLQGSARRA